MSESDLVPSSSPTSDATADAAFAAALAAAQPTTGESLLARSHQSPLLIVFLRHFG